MADKPEKTSSDAVAFVLLPRFNLMALATTLEPLRIANYIATRSLYAWRFLSVDGAPVKASNGMSLDTEALRTNEDHWDVVFVCGSWGSEHYRNAKLFRWLHRLDRQGTRLGAMDTGAYVLARAALLDGHKATIHWSCLRAFAEAYPDIEVQEQLFVLDRNRVTCAGGTAGLDMMLHELDRKHGRQLALEVADQILHFPLRDPQAPQRKTLGGKRKALHPVVHEAISLMEANLEDQLPIPALARSIGVSQRTLERLFKRYMGCTIVSFYQVVRLQHARVLLTNTKLSVTDVSVACGFSSVSHFSKSFSRHFGKRPRNYREAWPADDSAPAWPGTIASFIESGRGS